MNSLHLLQTQRFGPFFWTQFLGAFNDNFFKNALVVLVTFHTTQWTSMHPGLVALIASAIFMLPFFLFSAISGQIADKYPKNNIAQKVKLLEIFIMLFSFIGFIHHSLTILLVALFLFGIHSALFGPVKYAILPQHLPSNELLQGNALIEGGTFIAILLGTISGAIVASLPSIWMIPTIGLCVAILGYICSQKIPHAAPTQPTLTIQYNPWIATKNTLHIARSEPKAFECILAISSFWALGLLYLSQFPIITKNILHGNEITVSLLLGIFSVGIGLGSLACEKLSQHTPQASHVFNANKVLIAFSILFGIVLFTVPHVAILGWLTVFLGVAGGFYCVPLYTMMQQASPPQVQAQIVAANNITNSFFMVIAALVQALLLPYTGIGGLFVIFAVLQCLIFYKIYHN